MKNGFTIIELMLTIMVAAVVLSLGVPSFLESIRNNRMASQTNILLSSINFARSEAVKLGNATVTMCGSTNQATCNTSNWESGWIIFRDVNGNGTFDSSTDTLLRVQEALTGGNTLRTSGFAAATHVQFRNRGEIASAGSFMLCDSRGAGKAKGIAINISGQARSASDDDATPDHIVNIHDGSNLTCP